MNWVVIDSDNDVPPAHRRQTVTRTHYCDVIMSTMVSRITSLTIVYSAVHSDPDKRKHQSSASLAFVRGTHRRPVKSPRKWPVTRKMFPFDDVIMQFGLIVSWTLGTNLSVIEWKQKMLSRRYVWKSRLPIGGHFVHTSICYNVTMLHDPFATFPSDITSMCFTLQASGRGPPGYWPFGPIPVHGYRGPTYVEL